MGSREGDAASGSPERATGMTRSQPPRRRRGMRRRSQPSTRSALAHSRSSLPASSSAGPRGPPRKTRDRPWEGRRRSRAHPGFGSPGSHGSRSCTLPGQALQSTTGLDPHSHVSASWEHATPDTGGDPGQPPPVTPPLLAPPPLLAAPPLLAPPLLVALPLLAPLLAPLPFEAVPPPSPPPGLRGGSTTRHRGVGDCCPSHSLPNAHHASRKATSVPPEFRSVARESYPPSRHTVPSPDRGGREGADEGEPSTRG